jgi:two-component system response regulator AtoC
LDEELFYRLSAAHIPVPALRDRRQDIPLLVDHFMARFSETLGHSTLRLADEALARLTEYSWPGNLRELENVVERAMILADGDRIALQHLPVAIMTARSGDAKPERHDFSLRRARRAAEAAMIERALSATQGNRTHAAKLLEISHRALLYKIKDYQIRN